MEITRQDLTKNLERSVAWEKTRDLPDVVGLQDLISRKSLASGAAEERCLTGPEAGFEVRLPNPGRRPRNFTVGHPVDELVGRAYAGALAVPIEKHMPSDESGIVVYGSRLDRKPPGWTYQRVNIADRSRRADARARIRHAGFRGMGVADYESFYACIDETALQSVLLTLGCEAAAVVRFSDWVRTFMAGVAAHGIPVGPEASGLVASGFLVPLDAALREAGWSGIRWTDDVWVFPRDDQEWKEAEKVIRDVGLALGIRVAEDKTMFHPDRDGALRAIGASAGSGPDSEPGDDRQLSVAELADIFDSAVDGRDRRKMRFALGGLTKHGSSYAVSALHRCPALLDYAPRHWSDYLRAVHSDDSRHLAELLPLLESPELRDDSGLTALLLRALSSQPWGSPEGALFDQIADAYGDAPLIQAWALEAGSQCPRWSMDRTASISRGSSHSFVRRAATLACRRRTSRKVVRDLLADVVARGDIVSLSATWVLERPD